MQISVNKALMLPCIYTLRNDGIERLNPVTNVNICKVLKQIE